MKRSKSRLATVVALDDKRSEPRSLKLQDGAEARIVDRALELRDVEGRLLVRYVDGSAEIAAPSGDLVLSSPTGRVVVRSALDISLDASRDLVQRAGRSVAIGTGDATGARPSELTIEPRGTTLATPRVRVETTEAEIVAGSVSTVARKLVTRAESLAITAEKYELAATRIIEKSRDTFRDVVDLAQTRVGRARTVVTTLFSLTSRRSVLKSEEDTSIDGRKILLG